MSWHDFISAWNHPEDVVAVSPLTTNVCITCNETFTFKYQLQHIAMCHQFLKSPQACPWEKWWDRGRWGSPLVYPKGENSMAVSSFGCQNLSGVGEPFFLLF